MKEEFYPETRLNSANLIHESIKIFTLLSNALSQIVSGQDLKICSMSEYIKLTSRVTGKSSSLLWVFFRYCWENLVKFEC